jgi:hypothetical protein
MASDGTTMHPDFPRWYREVGIDENRDRLQRRWAGVSTLVQTMTKKDIENALRITFRAKSVPSADGLANIRRSFKDVDDLFDMQGNDREVEVLCGACLAVLMERDDDRAALGALAVTTAALNGTRAAELPMNLANLAEAAIGRIAECKRKRPDSEHLLSGFPKLSFGPAKEKLQQLDANGIGAAFDAAEAAVTQALKEFGNSIGKYIAIQDEELEMLWWVVGEHSEYRDQLFKDVGVKAQPLVFAKELADATGFLPGPSSVKGLLARAGLKESKKITIPEAVNACEASWLRSLGEKADTSPLSMPIHFAIGRKLETSDDDSWLAGWSSGCGIDGNKTFPMLTLGTLFYRERLLSIFAEE